MEFSKDIIGARIKESRIERGINAVEIAKTIGISKSAISQIESRRNAPDVVTLFKLCQLLNVSSDYLLGLSDVRERR